MKKFYFTKLHKSLGAFKNKSDSLHLQKNEELVHAM